MRIAMDGRAAVWYRGTGMGTYAYQLMRGLARIDQQSGYHFLLPGQQLSAAEFLRGNWQSVAHTKPKFWEQVVAERLEPRELTLPLDVYHIPHNGIGLPSRGVPQGCKLVVTVHDLIPYVMPETVGKGYLQLFLEEMPKILDQAEAVITVSQYSKTDLSQLLQVPEEKIKVIYEAPEEIYRPINKRLAQQYVAAHYGLNQPFVLYLGGFSPRKNLQGLLTGFAQVKQNYDGPLQLVIVGRDSPNLAQVWRQAVALKIQDEVKFCGFVGVEELPFFYNACACFAYPSFYEGFGLPPLEAMACGAAVVTSNAASLPEVAGRGALQVNPADAAAIGSAIYSVVSNDDFCRQLQQQGLQRAQTFTWEQTAIQTKAVYEELVLNE